MMALKKASIAAALLLCLAAAMLVLSPVMSVPAHCAEGGEGAAGGEHGGGGAHGGSGKAVDYAKRALNFGLLAAALVFLLRKPVGQFFGGRRKQIAQQLADLERARDAAQAQLKEYEKKLTAAAGERERILADFVAQGELEKKRILAEAEAGAGRIKDAARLTIEGELKAAKRQLREELADAAVELAQKKLEVGIKADDQSRLIDEYLTKVVEFK